MTTEELQDELLKLKENNKALELKYNEVMTKNKELTATNEKLLDHNNKLFMRLTTEEKEEPEEKPDSQLTSEELEQRAIDNITKLMHKEN